MLINHLPHTAINWSHRKSLSELARGKYRNPEWMHILDSKYKKVECVTSEALIIERVNNITKGHRKIRKILSWKISSDTFVKQYHWSQKWRSLVSLDWSLNGGNKAEIISVLEGDPFIWLLISLQNEKQGHLLIPHDVYSENNVLCQRAN